MTWTDLEHIVAQMPDLVKEIGRPFHRGRRLHLFTRTRSTGGYSSGKPETEVIDLSLSAEDGKCFFVLTRRYDPVQKHSCDLGLDAPRRFCAVDEVIAALKEVIGRNGGAYQATANRCQQMIGALCASS